MYFYNFFFVFFDLFILDLLLNTFSKKISHFSSLPFSSHKKDSLIFCFLRLTSDKRRVTSYSGTLIYLSPEILNQDETGQGHSKVIFFFWIKGIIIWKREEGGGVRENVCGRGERESEKRREEKKGKERKKERKCFFSKTFTFSSFSFLLSFRELISGHLE